MDRKETSPTLENLFHNASKARDLEKMVTSAARSLSLEDAKEILDKLQAALDVGRETLEIAKPEDLANRVKAEEALETIRSAREAADRCYQRKYRWAHHVEPNIQTIRNGAKRAAAIHRTLRRERRNLSASRVAEMREQLAPIDADAMSAWAAIRQANVGDDLEARLSRSIETIASALRDCERTFERKTQWEQAVATNVAAVEAELDQLERLVAQRTSPSEPVESSPEELVALAHKIEDMIRNRRPIDRPNRERLNTRLAELARQGDFLDRLSHHNRSRDVKRGPETDESLHEIISLLNRVETALGLEAPAEPATPEPREADTEPPASSDSTPQPGHEAEDEGTQTMLEENDIRPLQEALHQARQLLEAARLPRVQRSKLWTRFRVASAALRTQRNRLTAAAQERFTTMVQEAHRLATNDSPSQARKWIQATQKALAESVLGKRDREPFLESLREAWAAASKHQQEMREAHKRHRQEALDRLGGHFMRWQRRKEGITRILERLGHQLETYRERQKTSTSIGYRVVAEQRMAELKARVAELESVLAELDAKIADVAPRLEEAGWEPPKETGPDDQEDTR